MADLALRGLAKYGDGLTKLFESQFGVSPTKSGDDLIISDRQAGRAFASVDVLQMHPRLEIVEGQEVELADKLYLQIPDDLKRYQMPPPNEVYISSDYGLISRIEEAGTILAVSPDSEVKQCLVSKVLPAMVECYKATQVTGVSINAEYQQACISFSKIALLFQEYEPENVQKILEERKPLAGALPDSLDVLCYVESLTRLSPIMFTFPFRRQGCAWHFQTDGMYQFRSRDPVDGVAQQFLTDFSPLADTAHFLGLGGLRGMDARAIYQLLRFVVVGINRLMNYLNDPRNFVTSDGYIDFLKKVQAYAAMKLIFADLTAINYSTFAHNRISYAMSIMDKLANLRLNLGGIEGSEGRMMIGLASLSQRDHLKELIRSAGLRLAYGELSESLNETIDRCYDGLHEQLGRQCEGVRPTEASLLEKIWLQRNVRHGAFLRKKTFERLFLEADGTVPSTIGGLPFLLVLGLICDPGRFLSFNPTVEGHLQ